MTAGEAGIDIYNLTTVTHVLTKIHVLTKRPNMAMWVAPFDGLVTCWPDGRQTDLGELAAWSKHLRIRIHALEWLLTSRIPSLF